MMIKGVLPLFCALALAAEESAPPKKGEPSVQIELQGGWFSFGTTFADEDEPEQFAPEDPEKEQMEGLKENLGDETFGAIAAATGMDKRPDSLSRDGAMKARNVRIRPFAIDPFAVSNEQFGRFVREKRYKTEAENYQWSFVLEAVASNATINETDRDGGLGRVRDSPWWMGVMGAFWRRPEGPDSSVRGRAHHAAVHISWNDAHAYCEWAGRRLPTELEWEFAARGGLEDEPFPWGDATHDMHARLNAWEGEFPSENTERDGHVGQGPVDAYAPNAFGMYNMVGNVWEWCDGGTAEKRPMRGGSFVDTVDGTYNHAIRVSTRMDQTADSGSLNTGFRCASSLETKKNADGKEYYEIKQLDDQLEQLAARRHAAGKPEL